MAGHRAVFEVFARRLPAGRRYGVVAGTGRLLEALAAFRFEADQLAWLRQRGVVVARDARLAGRLPLLRHDHAATARASCSSAARRCSPSRARFAEAVVLETLVLSVLNHDSAVAAAGARMVTAAAGRPLVEAGGRRTHEWAAPAAARAAYLVGFAATSNLEAGRRYGVPTGGTAAHALVLAHATSGRPSAPSCAAAARPPPCWSTPTTCAPGVRPRGGRGRARASAPSASTPATSPRPPARPAAARRARRDRDPDRGLGRPRRVRDRGARAPRRSTGCWWAPPLVTGSGAPTAGFVYKLVAIATGPGAAAPLRPVAKTSPGKATRGGCKVAYRRYDAEGRPDGEVVRAVAEPQLVPPPDVVAAPGEGRRGPADRSGRVVEDGDRRPVRPRSGEGARPPRPLPRGAGGQGAGPRGRPARVRVRRHG